jgi:hypothetical protein
LRNIDIASVLYALVLTVLGWCLAYDSYTKVLQGVDGLRFGFDIAVATINTVSVDKILESRVARNWWEERTRNVHQKGTRKGLARKRG